ncbi:MAG: YkgJ family cysteine cluster protein [Proteobacteria bacterium]|nr:YkgJ family cysteine cluster protein [Pseudomonadota bacterium]MBU1715920.1 YkgJ family cysteine cluster protein [Pseudomonadota bacterium]
MISVLPGPFFKAVSRSDHVSDTVEDEIFKCQQCGYCCQGETTVSLNQDDIERLVAYLKMSFEEVRERYLRVTGNVTQMKTVDGHCIFFKDRCTVHPGKPWRCGQWPLHPSIIVDPANLEAIKDSCPGLLRDVGYEEFSRKLVDLLKSGKVKGG